MSLIIPACLSPSVLSQIRDGLPLLPWRDGRETAGTFARHMKTNEQADLSTRAGSKVKAALSQALTDNQTLQAIAWPKTISTLIVSRTHPGGGYDWHTDDALMSTHAGKLRTDLSFTLFLSAPEDYDGGALEIHSQGSIASHKYAAGDMVLYAAGALHRVEPVTKGTRIVCVGWIESLLRDPRHREILYDLATLRGTLSARYDPGTPETLTLSKTISNLLREWSET